MLVLYPYILYCSMFIGTVDHLLEETDWLTGGFEADGETLTLSDRPGLGVEVHL